MNSQILNAPKKLTSRIMNPNVHKSKICRVLFPEPEYTDSRTYAQVVVGTPKNAFFDKPCPGAPLKRANAFKPEELDILVKQLFPEKHGIKRSRDIFESL